MPQARLTLASAIRQSAYILLFFIAFFYIITSLKFLLAPLAMAGLLAFLLEPICEFYERWLGGITSIFLTLLTVLIPTVLFIYFAGYQVGSVFSNLPSIFDQVENGISKLLKWLNQNWGITTVDVEDWVQQNIGSILDAPLKIVTRGLTTSTTTLANTSMTAIFLFFFLLYRNGFYNFLVYQFPKNKRDQVKKAVSEVRKVVRGYLLGMLTLMLILGTLNSIGLYFIGIRYPFFWGFLAATMIIVPYIGTTLGGVLPFLYALATGDYWWQAPAVALMYWGIQNVDGTFITPNVVGSSVKINPLIAIIALIAGGFTWGIVGMILALPIAATLRVIFEHTDAFKPLGLLMSSDLHQNSGDFAEKYDGEQYRLSKILRGEAAGERKANKEEGKEEN
jgi:predicted PurR-regulated permease PerM